MDALLVIITNGSFKVAKEMRFIYLIMDIDIFEQGLSPDNLIKIYIFKIRYITSSLKNVSYTWINNTRVLSDQIFIYI